ncbi:MULTISPECIES: hypothetical protein [Methanobacterium]|jgi:hypothetical protein|uniref:Uncharacterized protein n=1 Tax=Methanobacterium veterum TaxID=408577 RepID=A0A9E4ZZN1_9EURY|nr:MULTISPECIES: hypothetical protein [Methanobacterium]MCZ3365475.1 hypothetical protein [Methanobacterium veterum]MCZ3373226.1 hypothetical protein [Methanobacterium veterum]
MIQNSTNATPNGTDISPHFTNVPNGKNMNPDIGIGHGAPHIDSGIHDGGITLGPFHIGPNGIDIGGIGTSYLSIVVGIANICLLIALIYIYMKNYRQLKSKFTMGLLVFASLLLLQNVVSTGFLILNLVMGMGQHGFDIDRPQFPLSSINVIQLIALSVLLKITLD